MNDIRTTPDRALETSAIYAEARVAEHAEIDCMGGGEFECSRCARDLDFLEAYRAEVERREREGIYIEDPDEPTLEERLEPYGLEWQAEQRERREEGYR